ncbi:MAG: acylphosphatase [Verrucomicrobiota bacterium]
MKTKRVIYEGRVQGVGFRYAVKEIARGFDVCGWVKNLDDGTVEMQAMGEAEELDSFLSEIRDNSPLAGNIRTAYESDIPPLENCHGFTISR